MGRGGADRLLKRGLLGAARIRQRQLPLRLAAARRGEQLMKHGKSYVLLFFLAFPLLSFSSQSNCSDIFTHFPILSLSFCIYFIFFPPCCSFFLPPHVFIHSVHWSNKLTPFPVRAISFVHYKLQHTLHAVGESVAYRAGIESSTGKIPTAPY